MAWRDKGATPPDMAVLPLLSTSNAMISFQARSKRKI
jgi:hypothetical protein